MRFTWSLIILSLAMLAGRSPAGAEEPGKPEGITFKAHKNHVRRASAEYLSWPRRMTFYYDHATAVELARETGRPMFVIFCRAGTIDDPLTGKAKCAS